MNGGEDRMDVRNKRENISRSRMHATVWTIGVLAVFVLVWTLLHPYRGADELLVIGYDSSRNYVTDAGSAFVDAYPEAAGQLRSLHAGSVQQAKNLARGLAADIILLASEAEMMQVQEGTGCLDPEWKGAFPGNSSPVSSTVVILVRRGNPHGIQDWRDLHNRRIQVSMPDPRWSGAGRYAYLSLLADALERHRTDRLSAEAEVRDLVVRMNLIPLGATSALDAFVLNTRQDALLTWESEVARLARLDRDPGLDVVYPARGIRARPLVAVMNCQTEKRGTTGLARAFVEFLYSPEGQLVAAANGLRPMSPVDLFPEDDRTARMELFDVERLFGSFAFALQIKGAREGGIE